MITVQEIHFNVPVVHEYYSCLYTIANFAGFKSYRSNLS
jgi:hypothetical protein